MTASDLADDQMTEHALRRFLDDVLGGSVPITVTPMVGGGSCEVFAIERGPSRWVLRRAPRHQIPAINSRPSPNNIQRISAKRVIPQSYIAAMRMASSTSTATRRDTPGSFMVTPTSCDAISIVSRLCVIKTN